MIIATTALLLTLLPATTAQAQAPADAQGAATAQRGTTGVIFSGDIDGRLAIYDSSRRMVVEIDKPGGRQVQIALDPGGYEARMAGRGDRRAHFAIEEGLLLLLGAANFDAQPLPPAPGPAPRHGLARDSRHRLEVRFGGSADGWYEGYGEHGTFSGTAQGAFGVEYLSFIRDDIGIGVGVTSLVRAEGCLDCFGNESARVLTSFPLVVRWYPVRRLSRIRTLEPYVTAGVGPVIGVDTIGSVDHHSWRRHGGYTNANVGMTVGGRVGAGVEFRLGQMFTLGAGGAWNWDAGFRDDLWRASRPDGGEFTLSLGWNFGR